MEHYYVIKRQEEYLTAICRNYASFDSDMVYALRFDSLEQAKQFSKYAYDFEQGECESFKILYVETTFKVIND